MNILVLNCGSSSIKYSLYRMNGGQEGNKAAAEPDPAPPAASGIVERIGEDQSRLVRTDAQGAKVARTIPAPDHRTAFALVLEALLDGDAAPLESLADIHAVGHRVVHGAERFTESCRIDDEVIAAIEACVPLAPLHNPPGLVGIRAAMEAVPAAMHVAVFDTAFHQTLPPRAYLYALPYRLYEKHGIRRYGFHGTSHRYVSRRAAAMLGVKPEQANLITCHLGNGCSMAAVRGGRSVDTSMGLTPLEGLVMGTRSGDMDPAIVLHLARTLGMDIDRMDHLLNRESGLLGLSGTSNDMRAVCDAADGGDDRADLAIDLFAYRIRKYVGAYTAVLGRVDALVLTGGIGENNRPVRRRLCEGLEPLGYVLDAEKNDAEAKGERDLAAAGSPRRILVIPTDEEAMIARDAARLVAPGA